MTDQDKERIRFNTEMIKLLGFIILATGGGTISLILGGLPNARHAVVAVIGMLAVITLGILTIFVYGQTKRLLK